MDSSALKDLAAILTPVLIFVIGIGIGVIGYFLKSLHRDIREKFAEAEKKIAQVERDFMEFKALMPRQYVLKDDYIRTIASFDLKLDSMDKKMDSLIRRGNDER